MAAKGTVPELADYQEEDQIDYGTGTSDEDLQCCTFCGQDSHTISQCRACQICKKSGHRTQDCCCKVATVKSDKAVGLQTRIHRTNSNLPCKLCTSRDHSAIHCPEVERLWPGISSEQLELILDGIPDEDNDDLDFSHPGPDLELQQLPRHRYCKYCNMSNHHELDCGNQKMQRQYHASLTWCHGCSMKGHDISVCQNPQVAEISLTDFGPESRSAMHSKHASVRHGAGIEQRMQPSLSPRPYARASPAVLPAPPSTSPPTITQHRTAPWFTYEQPTNSLSFLSGLPLSASTAYLNDTIVTAATSWLAHNTIKELARRIAYYPWIYLQDASAC